MSVPTKAALGPLLGKSRRVSYKVNRLFRLIWHGLALWGLVSLMGGAYVGYRILHSYDLTPRQLVVKAAHKFGLFPEQVAEVVRPGPRYQAKSLQGQMLSGHPRILFSGREAVSDLRRRYASDVAYKKRVDEVAAGGGIISSAVAWVCRGDRAAGQKAVDTLLDAVLETPRAEGNYGNGLEIALAYDLLGDHPAWSPENRQRLNLKLRKNLQDSMLVLDGDSASLWHGRTQLAASAWVVAAAMDSHGPEDTLLQAQAQRHFLESVEAFRLSGGWPEGYNYWINNRAFPFALACLAHINAVREGDLKALMVDTLTRLGLWTLLGTEPIGRFVLYADTGPRNDLKDETQRVVDLVTLGTGLPIFRDYSRYLTGLHGSEAYYSGYRWGIPLFRGLAEWDHGPEDALQDLSVLEGRVPRSAVFGREMGMGQVFIRSDWGPKATFISFHAGHTLTHHGHYHAGHFTVTKKIPLAITSGTYGGFTSPHRLHYYIRTVAANSLLVLRPGERVQPNRFFETNVADGGQRLVMPTGSAVVSLADWRANLHKGRHYEGGTITAFDNHDPRFVYVASDLTGAYNNTRYDDNGEDGKVEKVERSLVYLAREDALVIYDRVAAVQPHFTKKWLLHSWTKPETARERVLVGTQDNGILESQDRLAVFRRDQANLYVYTLLPEDAVLRKVGGVDYRYYVEVDGDDGDLDGINMGEGASEQPWFDAGLWRLEIQPAGKRKADCFLIALKPSLAGEASTFSEPPVRIDAGRAEGILWGHTVVLFGKDGNIQDEVSYLVPERAQPMFHLMVNLPAGTPVMISSAGIEHRTQANNEGVALFETPAGPAGRVTVRIGRM